MIIRNQDKRGIVNFNQLTDLCVAKNRVGEWEIVACYPYFADSDCGFSALAAYSTEAKAIKVLDMICADIILECLIFQMPADEDVEV